MAQHQKVVFLHNIISPHNTPLFAELAKHKGFHFKFIFLSPMDPNRPWNAEKKYLFNYTILHGKRLTLRGSDTFSFYLNPSIFHNLKIFNPDIVVISGWDHPTYWLAALWARFNKKKLILWAGSTADESSWRRTLSLPLVKFLIRLCHQFVAYGTKSRHYLISLGAKPEKIIISINTTDITPYLNIPSKRKSSQKVNLLFYGQLIDRKGPFQLLQAFNSISKSYPHLSLTFAGNGPLSDKLKGDRVKVISYPGEARMVNYFASADIFIHPAREEVWGLVINQAMASSLPIITTTQTGAAADLVFHGKNGLVLANNSPTSLARSISQILRQDYIAMGKNSRQIIKDFTPKTSASQFLKALSN